MINLSCVSVDDDVDLFFFKFKNAVVTLVINEENKKDLVKFLTRITVIGDDIQYTCKDRMMFEFHRINPNAGKLFINAPCGDGVMLDVTDYDVSTLYIELKRSVDSYESSEHNK